MLCPSRLSILGVLIAPQNISNVWIWAYYVFPLHYVIEGLLMSQYHDSDIPILATSGGDWYVSLQCTGSPCYGTAAEFFNWRFGGFFSFEHIPWNALYLVCFIIFTKVVQLIALSQLNYLAK